MPQLCDHDEPCGCYAEGYAAGQDKAFFDIQSVPGMATLSIAPAILASRLGCWSSASRKALFGVCPSRCAWRSIDGWKLREDEERSWYSP